MWHSCVYGGRNGLIGRFNRVGSVFSNPLYKRIETDGDDDDDVTSKIQRRPGIGVKDSCSLIVIVSADRKQIDNYADVVTVIKSALRIKSDSARCTINDGQEKKRVRQFE